MKLNLDRRVEGLSLPRSYSGGSTTWTLPYSVAADGSQGEIAVVRQDTDTRVTCTRPGATQVSVVGDLTGVAVWIGVLYEFRYVPTRIYPRGDSGEPEMAGRLQLRHIDVGYADTDSLTVEVSRTGRSAMSAPVTSPGTGKIHVGVLAQNTQTALAITDRSPGAVRLIGFDWEGFISQRAKRV